MEQRWGQRGTVVDDVFFTEGSLDGSSLGDVSVKIGRQNSNLGEVKRRLAAEVKKRGGNALSQFTYGQKGRKWWAINWDEEAWHGAGVAVLVSDPTAPDR